MIRMSSQEFFERYIQPGMDEESDYDPSEWEEVA